MKKIYISRKNNKEVSLNQIKKEHEQWLNSKNFADSNYQFEEFEHFVHANYIIKE